MALSAVSIEGLWKQYLLGGVLASDRPDTLRDVLGSALKNPGRLLKRFSAPREPFWALRDVSFQIPEGEVLGVVGSNGAGKSTLLKILTRITDPTRGRVTLRGRVASLLEVGTGFHPDLTGRENVYLNGAILSMTREEIRRRFDEIVEFSEIGPFIDTPVKRYSSGMYMRLAFAIAAHLDTDILLVDEVLAVGDASFQAKCLGTMEAIGRKGRTVVFVSHNMAAVTRLCHRVVWLKQGQVAKDGEPKATVREYLGAGATSAGSWAPSVPASKYFDYHEVFLEIPGGGRVVEAVPGDQEFDVVFDYTVREGLRPGRLAFLLADEAGQVAFTSASTDGFDTLDRPWPQGRFRSTCRVPGCWLAPGRYVLTVSEPSDGRADPIHHAVLSFLVTQEGSLAGRDSRWGIFAPLLPWTIESTRDSDGH